MANSISSLERQGQILQHLFQNQRISIDEVCERFSVSAATARRDLQELSQAGKIQRVHGGAISLPLTPPEQPLLQRSDEQAQEKRRIGKVAATLVQDGETIFLGSGTTVLEIARALTDGRRLTILTNSLPVVNVLAGVEGKTVICMGGMLRDHELSFIGHITEQALKEVRADKVFIGTRAISLEHGLTHEYLPETMTDRAILNSGGEVFVVTDHTKFDRSAVILLAPLSAVHTIITDEGTPPTIVHAVREKGIRVIIC